MRINLNFRKVFLYLGLFLLTLVSHTIYAWSLGLALLISYIFFYRVKIPLKPIKDLLLFIFIALSFALHFQIFGIDEADPIFKQAFWGRLSAMILLILVWFFLRVLLLSTHKKELLGLIQPLLIAHVVVFYAQFFVYLATGYYLDFLEPFTGEVSRYSSFDSSLVGIGSFRPTGFFSEPSTYFMCVLALLFLGLIHNNLHISNKLMLMTVISMYLSFSTAAVIITTVFLIYFFYAKGLNIKYYFSLVIIMLVIALPNASTLERLFQSQVIKFDDSSAMRFRLIELAASRKLDDAFFSSGLFAMDSEIYHATDTVDIGEKREVGSLNDTGLLVYLWVFLGYSGILFFIFLCFKEKKTGKYRLPLFLILTLTKISLFHPLFILYLAVSLEKFNTTS